MIQLQDNQTSSLRCNHALIFFPPRKYPPPQLKDDTPPPPRLKPVNFSVFQCVLMQICPSRIFTLPNIFLYPPFQISRNNPVFKQCNRLMLLIRLYYHTSLYNYPSHCKNISFFKENDGRSVSHNISDLTYLWHICVTQNHLSVC